MKVKFKVISAPQHIKKIECAQGFNVQKISEHEALIARQSSKACAVSSFKGALSIAGLKYNEKKLLRNNEKYTGYVAIFICLSEIVVAWVDGSLFLKKQGSNVSYSTIAVDGTLFWVDDIGAKLTKGLKNEKISRSLFEKAIGGLKANAEFEVTETEMRTLAKVCCPDCIEVTYSK